MSFSKPVNQTLHYSYLKIVHKHTYPLGSKWVKGKGKGKEKECKGMSEVGNQYLTPQFTI